MLAIHDSPPYCRDQEDDVMAYHFYYLSRATTLNSANTKLVTLAPGLRLERRFAPLARGLYIVSLFPQAIDEFCLWKSLKSEMP